MDYLLKKEYRISLTTMALQRAFHMKYQTIIYDVNGTFYSEQPMKTLLEESCLRGGSKMQGRLEAAKHALAIRNKIPLIIDPLNYLYAFPTHSSTHDQNIWVFPLHIDGQQSQSENKKQTKIVFRNQTFMYANCSYRTFQAQRKRTSLLFYDYSFTPKIHLKPLSDPFKI